MKDVTFEDGKPVFPKKGRYRPKTRTDTRTRKILIYAEFPSLTPVLQNVRELLYF